MLLPLKKGSGLSPHKIRYQAIRYRYPASGGVKTNAAACRETACITISQQRDAVQLQNKKHIVQLDLIIKKIYGMFLKK
jgi:hypothetical protein